MFISSYTVIYFFVNNFFSECLYFSVIFKCSYLSFGWEIGYPLSMYVTRRIKGAHPKCVQLRTGGEKAFTPHAYECTYTISLHVLSYGVLFYLQKFNLTFIRKKCVCQKWLFFSNDITFCCNKTSFFYFNFNLIESYVYSIFGSSVIILVYDKIFPKWNSLVKNSAKEQVTKQNTK